MNSIRKLLLTILGLFPIRMKFSNGIVYDLGITKADILKESYYKNVDRKNCFCGGKIKDTYYGINLAILKCNQCGKRYIGGLK